MNSFKFKISVALFVLIFLHACKVNYTVDSTSEEFLRIDKKLDSGSLSHMDSIILPYKTELDASMNKIIGNSSGLKADKPESTLGNWVADALLDEANKMSSIKVDFAAQNYGGLRIKELAQGPITTGKIYELMPFENYLTILTVDGNVAKDFLNRIAIYGGWPISKNISFKIEGDKAQNIIIGGKPLDENKKYRIALPDYVANGGDDCDFFAGMPQENTGELIREILIKTVKQSSEKNQSISGKIEGRIK